MIKINPYLNFFGNAEVVFDFYQSIFGGEFASKMKFKDMPFEGQDKMSEESLNKIMHIALPIGNDILMGSDSLEERGHEHIEGNNFHITVNVDSKEEADRIYNLLSVGGNITLPIGDVPWGDYFAMFSDKFGIYWMISYTYPK